MKGPPFWGSGRGGAAAACLPACPEGLGTLCAPILGLECWGLGTLRKLEAGSCLLLQPCSGFLPSSSSSQRPTPDIPDALISKAQVLLDSTFLREGHFTSFEPSVFSSAGMSDITTLRFLWSCYHAPSPLPSIQMVP